MPRLRGLLSVGLAFHTFRIGENTAVFKGLA